MKHWFLNVKQAYKNLPIARKMSFTTILVMSLFLCMITAISATISSEILIRNNSKAASRNLELIRLRTEDLLDNAEQFSGIVVSNYYIQRSLTVADQSTRYQYDQLVGSILDPITSTRSSVSSIVVYGQDGRAVSSSNVRTSDPSVQEEYKKYAPTMAGEWNHLFWDDIHDLSYETGSEETNRGVSLRRNIISINDGSIAGFVVLNVNDHIFTDLYMDLTTEDGIHMMIVDSSGNIISSSDTKANPVRLADTPYFQWMQETRNGSRRFTVDNEKYLINTCYLERNERIKKSDQLCRTPGKTIINMESGGFRGFPQGDFDRLLDARSDAPGIFPYEKMVSGRYLAPLIDLVLRGAIEEGVLSPYFEAAYRKLPLLTLREVDTFLAGEGPLIGCCAEREGDRTGLRERLTILLDRAARMVAVNLAAIFLQTGAGRDGNRPAIIAVDGSTYHRSPTLQERLRVHLDALLGGTLGRSYTLYRAEATTLIGTAIAALTHR